MLDESHQLRRRKANRGLCQLRPMKAVSLEAFREQAEVPCRPTTAILTQSAGLTLNTNRARLNGSAPASRTSAVSPSGPLRKSTGCVAKTMRALGGNICGVSVIR